MTSSIKTLAALALLGALSTGIHAQTAPPLPPIVPSDAPPPKPAPSPSETQAPQSPAAPTSAGAVVIKYKVEMLDKNGDGTISRQEAAAVPELLKVFDQLDINHDGKLDEGELSRYAK